MTVSRLMAAAILLACFASIASIARAQITPPRLVRTPDIHGDRIVFSAEGDLWLGSLATGIAERITTHEGMEINPRFSPDGKWIAFTGSYDGGQDVYVMPLEGGAPRRLTYDPYGAQMAGWTPDGRSVLFRSQRTVPMVGPRLYTVPLSGGIAVPLPMERAAQGSFAPDGKRLAYCRLPLESHRWKRYRGGEANRVWLGDLEKKTFKKINDDTINEQYPVWVDNAVYYVSERDGTANLWKYEVSTGKSNRVTSHDTYDVKAPSSDGKQIIYEWGNELLVYNISSGKETPVKLTLTSDRIHARPHLIAGSIGTLALGPTGKRLLTETRGQMFTMPAEKGEVRAVAPLIGTRSRQPVWSPDGKFIAFISDRSGDDNLWVVPANGQGDPIQLTNVPGLRLSGPLWAPDSKRIAVSTNSQYLWLVDIDTKATAEIAHCDYNEIHDYAFSPDGKWLSYSRGENFNVQSLYLYNIEQKQATRLTFPPTRDHTPTFDPAGKYLYFLSERSVTPRGDSFDFQNNFNKTTRIYLLALAADTPAPNPVDSDEEPDGKSTDPTNDQKKEEDKKEKDTTKLPDVKVDLEGIAERIMEVPVPAGDYGSLDALKDKLLYSFGEENGLALKSYDFSTKKETTLVSGLIAYALSGDRKKMAVRTGGGIQIIDAGAAVSPSTDKVDLRGWQIPVNPEAEWKQMFLEAWRNQRDLFYDPDLHGQNWEAVRKKYMALLPSVGARAELNEVIGEMQGEMNVSHQGVGGGYQQRNPAPSPGFGQLGAELTYDAVGKAYKIVHIFRGDGFDMNARSPLLTPGLKVKEGDYVLAINGVPLLADQEPNALLIGQGGKTVSLLVNSTPIREGARTIRIKALNNEARARYYDWVSHNRDYVARNGGANIGYLHLPDMSDDGITEFTKHFYANLDKDGLIIDVRYNGGGIVSGQILERLRRVIFEYDQGRYGAPVPYHYTAYMGRLVVICNERTGSDGEYFSTGFKYMKLGPTCGTRTWGGYCAVGGFDLIDGGVARTPLASSFTPEEKWLPDGYGFAPDYVVEEDPNAFVAGRDPQLDKAIELLKAEIQKNPPKHARRLPPPSKEKAFTPNKP